MLHAIVPSLLSLLPSLSALYDFYDFRAGVGIVCDLAVKQFDSYDSDEEADDAAGNFQVDYIHRLGLGHQTANKDAGSGHQERHDEADECANDDIDFPHFELDMLPDFRPDRIQRLDDDVLCPITGTAGNTVGMTANFDIDETIII